MSKIHKIFLVFLLGLSMTGCGLQNKPEDFWFEYKWTGPQVPAPEHQEYIIKVDKTGEGKLFFYPDYMIETVDEAKLWQRDFLVDQVKMSELHLLFKDNGVFEPENMEEETVNFREGYGTLWANDKTGGYFIKITGTSEENLVNMTNQIKSLVPANFWQEMEAEKQMIIRRNPDILDYELPELEY